MSALPATGDVEPLTRSGHRDVGDPKLLENCAFATWLDPVVCEPLGRGGTGVRQQPFLHSYDEDDGPFATLRSVDRRQQDTVHVIGRRGRLFAEVKLGQPV